jgi:hypothetical protein
LTTLWFLQGIIYGCDCSNLSPVEKCLAVIAHGADIHGDEEMPAFLGNFVDGANIRVIQRCSGTRFKPEACIRSNFASRLFPTANDKRPSVP